QCGCDCLQPAGQRSESDVSGFSRHGRSTIRSARSRETPGADRNARERNRRRERAVASLGKYHSAVAESDTDAEPDAIGFARWKSDDSRSVADFDFRVSARESFAFAQVILY